MKKKITIMPTMYLDVTKKVGDESAIKTSEQVTRETIKELQSALRWWVENYATAPIVAKRCIAQEHLKKFLKDARYEY